MLTSIINKDLIGVRTQLRFGRIINEAHIRAALMNGDYNIFNYIVKNISYSLQSVVTIALAILSEDAQIIQYVKENMGMKLYPKNISDMISAIQNTDLDYIKKHLDDFNKCSRTSLCAISIPKSDIQVFKIFYNSILHDESNMLMKLSAVFNRGDIFIFLYEINSSNTRAANLYFLEMGNLPMVKWLYARGHNVFPITECKGTNNVECYRWALSNQIDIGPITKKHIKNTIENGNLELCKLICGLVNFDFSGYMDAFITAATFGRIEICEWLLSQNVDPHMENDTAFGMAIQMGHLEMCQWLFQRLNINLSQFSWHIYDDIDPKLMGWLISIYLKQNAKTKFKKISGAKAYLKQHDMQINALCQAKWIINKFYGNKPMFDANVFIIIEEHLFY